MINILKSPRFWLHVFFPGIPNAILCVYYPAMGISIAGGFLAYEMWQGHRIRDDAWVDIRGWLAGMTATGIIILMIERML